jgi:GTP-binding protein
LNHVAEALNEALPAPEEEEPTGGGGGGIRITVLGRPNVGKSTLVNRMLGEERMVTSDIAGTTRDSVAIPFERDGQKYTLIDTAGVRRRARIDDTLEKFSVLKTLEAIDQAEVVIVVLSATDGIVDQDLHLLGLVVASGRSLLLAVNKWDGLPTERRREVEEELLRKFRFMDYAEIHYISALRGSGVGNLFGAIKKAWESAYVSLPTHQITEILQGAVIAHPPPLGAHGIRPKLRYAHMGGHNPPRIIIHGNQSEGLPDAYRRYLEGAYRKALRLVGTPVKVEFRQGENPFAGKKNVLSPRQILKRQRQRRHVQKKK